MLRTMRSNLKTLSWTLWLVILAFVGFIFVEWGMGTDAIGGDNKSYLMSIDGETITMQDFKHYQSLFKWTNPQTLEILKQNGILSYEAKKLNMIASDEELNSQIFDLFQYKGVFIGMDQYRNFLTRNKMSIKSFENFLKRFFILPKKYINFVNSAQVINEDTLAKKFRKARDFAEIEYIKISPEWIKDEIQVTDKEQKEYYTKNKNNYFAPEKRTGLVVSIKLEEIKKNNLVSDQEIETYYERNKAQFQKKEQIRVSRIFLNYTKKNRKDIETLANDIKQHLTIKNFEQKAKEFSQDEKSSIGGDWGYDLDKLIKKERKIARTMEVSQISDLIYTGKSISILHVTEKSAEKTKPLSLVKNIIKDKLEPEKIKAIAKQKISTIIEKLKKNTKIEDIKSEDFIINETGFVKKDQVIQGIDESSTLSNKLFTLKENGVSDILELIQDTKQNFGVVKCLKIQKAGIVKLENVKDNVNKDVIKTKKADLLKIKSPAITKELNLLKDKVKIEEYLKNQKLLVDTFRYKRGNRLLYFPEKEGLDKMVFSLEAGIYSAPIIYSNTAVVIKLKSKTITNDDEFKKERTSFYSSALKLKTNQYWQNFLIAKTDLYQKQEKLKMNAELVTNLLKQKTTK